MDQQADAIAITGPSRAVRPDESHRAAYDGDKPPHEIEEDIARTRARLGAAIEALEHELTPRRVIEKSTEVLRNSLEPGPGPFREQVWAYAIPLALIATGLGWLFVLRRSSYQSDLPSSFGETPAEVVETGETPIPTARYATVVDPVEPVFLADEKPAI
jgi:hypothetical protein